MFISLVGQKPHPEELLYSYQARLRAHFAVNSPKVFMESLYGNRGISASVTYASHLEQLIESLDFQNDWTPKSFIYKHTLFPLTASFIPQTRRNKAEQIMSSGNASGVHVMTGYVASSIPKLKFLRCCSGCMEEQLREHGEPFWLRLHQVSSLLTCPYHRLKLREVKGTNIGRHRHAFIPLMLSDTPQIAEPMTCRYDEVIAQQCIKLFECVDLPLSPSYAQWTNYYIGLARSHGYDKGQYVDYGKIKARIDSVWPSKILLRYNLALSETHSCWLHAIFRKHRKSFSYLQHIVVLFAFIGDELDIITCIHKAKRSRRSARKLNKTIPKLFAPIEVMEKKKVEWLDALESNSIASARKLFPSLYAALYRYDRDWLLKINQSHYTARQSPSDRVNWLKRDMTHARKLLPIIYDIDSNLAQPKASKKWLMSQLQNSAGVEKYIDKLPITKKCLSRYAETVSDYQIRRVSYQLINNRHPYITRRWFLLRCSGLSEKRITNQTQLFLEAIGEQLPLLGHLPFDDPKTTVLWED